MIKNIFENWTWTRALYFFVGVFVLLQGAMDSQWIGLLGIWPAVMGLFGLSCAAGNCASGVCEAQPVKLHKK